MTTEQPRTEALYDIAVSIGQLLENSSEHADKPHEEVCVAVRSYEDRGAVVLELTDDGPGIPQEELNILAQHGSGAGLWMVDRIVEYSNATIEFNTDDGTTVRLRLDPAQGSSTSTPE